MSKSHYGSKNRKQTDADGDWQGVLYSTANDPQPQMIPRPQMILDRK